MKKVIAILLAFIMLFGMTACSDTTKEDDTNKSISLGKIDGIDYTYTTEKYESDRGNSTYPVLSAAGIPAIDTINTKIKEAVMCGYDTFAYLNDGSQYNCTSKPLAIAKDILTVEYKATLKNATSKVDEPFLFYDNYSIKTGELVNPSELVDLSKISLAFITRDGISPHDDKVDAELFSKQCDYVSSMFGKDSGEQLSNSVYSTDGKRQLTYFSLMFNGDDNLVVIYDVDGSLGTIATFEFDRDTFTQPSYK